MGGEAWKQKIQADSEKSPKSKLFKEKYLKNLVPKPKRKLKASNSWLKALKEDPKRNENPYLRRNY